MSNNFFYLFFFSENRAVYEIVWETWYSLTG